MMDHPPCSPDFALSDFWLFDYIKQRLDDHTSAESRQANNQDSQRHTQKRVAKDL